MAAVLLVNLSYPEWTGGWSTGPRLLVPLLPFAMLPVAGLLAATRPSFPRSAWECSPAAPRPPRDGDTEGDAERPQRHSHAERGNEGRARPGRLIRHGLTTLAMILAVLGGIVILAFQGVGARIPDPIRDKPAGYKDPLEEPLLRALPPIWRGEALPGWVFGQRYARNVVSIVWPDRVAKMPPGTQWLQFVPLVAFQAIAIGLLLLVTRPTAHRDVPSVVARPPARPDPA
jgi:hypothetical protein